MGTMFVWSSPVLNYLDPDYCPNYHCDLTLTKQEAVWVNAIAFFGCIFSVPMAGEIIMIRHNKVVPTPLGGVPFTEIDISDHGLTMSLSEHQKDLQIPF